MIADLPDEPGIPVEEVEDYTKGFPYFCPSCQVFMFHAECWCCGATEGLQRRIPVFIAEMHYNSKKDVNPQWLAGLTTTTTP